MMDSEGVKQVLRRYRNLLDAQIERMEKLSDKAGGMDFPDGVAFGETVISLHQLEQAKVDEAIRWLEEGGPSDGGQ